MFVPAIVNVNISILAVTEADDAKQTIEVVYAMVAHWIDPRLLFAGT